VIGIGGGGTNNTFTNATLISPTITNGIFSGSATYTNNGVVYYLNAAGVLHSNLITGYVSSVPTNQSFNTTYGVFIGTNGTVPSPLASGGWLWNSNNALYWETTTHTNLLSAP
jgi:hypothetical protein